MMRANDKNKRELRGGNEKKKNKRVGRVCLGVEEEISHEKGVRNDKGVGEY